MKKQRVTKSMKKEAERLASLPYHIHIIEQTTINGRPVTVANFLELPHCIAQVYEGVHFKSAMQTVLYEYILTGLQYGQRPPPALTLTTITTSSAALV